MKSPVRDLHMIRLVAVVAGVLLATLFPGALGETFAASQQDYGDCSQTNDPGRSIAACARIVSDTGESEVDRAAAYVSLGNGYAARGDLGKAAAMYSVAVQMDQKDIFAFAARAVVNARLGERDRAVADYQQACALDAARLIEMTAANNDLKAIAASAQCEPPREWGAIVQGWADGGDNFIGMKFGAKTPEEAAATAISRCLAQCRELSPAHACQQGCDDSVMNSFGPGECGYFTIGQMSSPIVVSHTGIGHTKQEAMDACRSDITGNYECDEEPIGGCNK
jgi:tetratricopeptide (TPR) repeat protein